MTPSELSDVLAGAVKAAVAAGDLPEGLPSVTPVVERPKRPEHGDYATSLALVLAKPAGLPPRKVAEILVRHLDDPAIASVEIAGPGFLNLRFATQAIGGIAATIVTAGAGYGSSTSGVGQKINLEFVSANPTGPIHLGSTRWAAIGSSLTNILRFTGASVATEYYVNDAGNQMVKFAETLDAVAHGDEVPEGGYQGGYITDVVSAITKTDPGVLELPTEQRIPALRTLGLDAMITEARAALSGFRVDFDTWFSELSLESSGAITKALDRLKAGGHVYELDGATWLRTTDFGDDKDRVLVKSDGETTYFTSDAAYYLDKRDRGFGKVVIMLGADHHGYVGRMRAMAACYGDDPAQTLELPIGQLVSVVRDGVVVKMSKRAGTFISLEDLVEMVGVDAARYSLARVGADTPLELDLGVLTTNDRSNPVWSVQYAHARTAGVLRNAAEMEVELPSVAAEAGAMGLSDVALALLTHEKESELLRVLGEFPAVVATAAELRAPHRVARYLEEEVAPSYHRFYEACRVLPRDDEEVTPLTYARLLVVRATQQVLANALGLLGVSAPDRM